MGIEHLTGLWFRLLSAAPMVLTRLIQLTISASFSIFMTPPDGDREQSFWMHVDQRQARTPLQKTRRYDRVLPSWVL